MEGIFFQINIDGKQVPEEFKSFEEAKEAAHLYFAANKNLRKAIIIRIKKEIIGYTENRR